MKGRLMGIIALVIVAAFYGAVVYELYAIFF